MENAGWMRVHPLVVRVTHWINVLAVLMMLTLILAQALSGATRTFFDVGPGDFVLTAPVPPQRLFAIRALAPEPG